MTPLPFFQVDAFADGPFTGNPAAVMPLDHWLDDATMQLIAAENNLSETAFTVPSERDDADYDLRWFTPTMEVPLCGHATLAAAHILLRGAAVRFATQAGILAVSRDAEDEALLKLDLPAARLTEVSEPEVCEALGLSARPLWLADGRLIFAREGLPGSWDLWSVRMGPQAAPQRDSERRLTVFPRGESADRERGVSTDGRFLYLPIEQLNASDVWLGEAR